jgi:curved DNA-binding protein CbpA
LNFGASEIEIKKRFRKLATIHHPDKNGGSKKSEEIFKIILNAYEILSKKETRAIYDLKYKQHFQQSKSESANQKKPNNKHDKSEQYQSRSRANQRRDTTKQKVNYSFWVIVVLLVFLYLYNSNKTAETENSNSNKQLENRPQSGELDFKK